MELYEVIVAFAVLLLIVFAFVFGLFWLIHHYQDRRSEHENLRLSETHRHLEVTSRNTSATIANALKIASGTVSFSNLAEAGARRRHVDEANEEPAAGPGTCARETTGTLAASASECPPATPPAPNVTPDGPPAEIPRADPDYEEAMADRTGSTSSSDTESFASDEGAVGWAPLDTYISKDMQVGKWYSSFLYEYLKTSNTVQGLRRRFTGKPKITNVNPSPPPQGSFSNSWSRSRSSDSLLNDTIATTHLDDQLLMTSGDGMAF